MPAWYPRCQPLPGRLPRPASDDATRACQPGKRKWLLFSYGAREWYRKDMKWPSVAILFFPLPPCLSCPFFLSLTLSHRLIADSGTIVWSGTQAYAWQSQGLTCQLPPLPTCPHCCLGAWGFPAPCPALGINSNSTQLHGPSFLCFCRDSPSKPNQGELQLQSSGFLKAQLRGGAAPAIYRAGRVHHTELGLLTESGSLG